MVYEHKMGNNWQFCYFGFMEIKKKQCKALSTKWNRQMVDTNFQLSFHGAFPTWVPFDTSDILFKKMKDFIKVHQNQQTLFHYW